MSVGRPFSSNDGGLAVVSDEAAYAVFAMGSDRAVSYGTELRFQTKQQDHLLRVQLNLPCRRNHTLL